jgi:hypothetical protein
VVLADFEHRLRAVEWARYGQGGFGASVAEMILGLISKDDVERQKSCSQLEDCLLPQGVLDEVSYHAIPFLVELIKEGVAPGCVYELLVPMTIAAQPDAYDEGIEIAGEAKSLTEACRRRIAGGLDFYLRDLQNRNLAKDPRLAALSTACRIRERRSEWLPIIRRVYGTEDDAEMRSAIWEWLSDETQESGDC